jgi:hypothetical protein
MSSKFEVDDVVYLVESAKLGFLESYKVKGIRQDSQGQWWYTFVVSQRSTTATATVGDSNTLKHQSRWELAEAELTTYCEALGSAEMYLQAQLDKVQLLRRSACGDASV